MCLRVYRYFNAPHLTNKVSQRRNSIQAIYELPLPISGASIIPRLDLHLETALAGARLPERSPIITSTNKHAPVSASALRHHATKKALVGLSEHAMLNAFRTSTTLLNSSLFASRPTFSSFALGVRVHAARSYATEAALPSTSSPNTVALVGKGKKNDVPEGPLRPHLGVEVNPNHGLWAFFRKTVGKDGVESYETIEKKDNAIHYSGAVFLYGLYARLRFPFHILKLNCLYFWLLHSDAGRAWSAAELRRKSFRDLHTLWYVVLRERNLLETQLLEMNRLGAMLDLTPIKQRMFRVRPPPPHPRTKLTLKLQCRKTMARIKYVINERRVAYEGAVKIITEGNEHQVLAREGSSAQVTAPLGEQPTVGEAEEPPVVVHKTAAERAAAGLIQPGAERK